MKIWILCTGAGIANIVKPFGWRDGQKDLDLKNSLLKSYTCNCRARYISGEEQNYAVKQGRLQLLVLFQTCQGLQDALQILIDTIPLNLRSKLTYLTMKVYEHRLYLTNICEHRKYVFPPQ